MAGSHKSGAASAKAHLFENAFYVLTPFADTPAEKLEELQNWLKGTGARFVIMDAEKHDTLTGIVSHFPHIMAASLVRLVQQHAAEDHDVSRLAAGGFRDITRIASSSPQMWTDIIAQNRRNMLKLLDEWQLEMQEVRRLVEKGEPDSLHSFFSSAKKYRDSLPAREKGAISSFYDLFVDVLDKPGVISDITARLAKENISLTNIRIIEAREDVFGVLRLSFQTENDREKARYMLEEASYSTYITI